MRKILIAIDAALALNLRLFKIFLIRDKIKALKSTEGSDMEHLGFKCVSDK